MRPLRVLHGPLDTAGLAVGLARAERAVGLHSDAVLFHRRRMGSASGEADPHVHCLNIPLHRGAEPPARFYARKAAAWARALDWMRRNLPRYDVISYTYGTSFLMPPLLGAWWHEAPLLSRAGKVIAVTFQGCDARLHDCAEKLEYGMCPHCRLCEGTSITNWQKWAGVKRRRLRMWERDADLIFYHNPDLRRYLRRGEFRAYSKVDWREWTPAPREQGAKLRIGHAPTDRNVKGTREVLRAIESLKQRRDDFEFVLIENVPYAQVRPLYQSLDLMIDQLWAGWYGGAAVEAMALEVPVMAYIRQSDLRYIPQRFAADLPIIDVTADTLERTLEEWLDSPARLRERGKQSREFVIQHHDPLRIAATMKQRYEQALDEREGGR